MKVWLVTVGEPLPIDGKNERLYRTGILSEMLVRYGYEVIWWTSTFDHIRKQQRFRCDTTVYCDNGLMIKLLHGCGYKRNISVRRIIEHVMIARKFRHVAETEVCPDIILCSLPTLELSVAVVQYGIKKRIPVIIDIRDLWPDILLEVIPYWLRLAMQCMLIPMWMQARKACCNASAITRNSPHFVGCGLRLAKRNATPFDRAFWHGYQVNMPKEKEIEAAHNFWMNFNVSAKNGEFLACFFGAIGVQSEFETVIGAAQQLAKLGKCFKFVVCGNGDRLKELRKLADGVSSVIFPGWVGRAEIWTLMRMSQVGLAVYRSNIGYVTNLPNKPIEYLSAGLPVISSLSGCLEKFLTEHGCGLTYQNEKPDALVSILEDLDNNREKLILMSKNAKRVFEEMFNADKIGRASCRER